MVNVCVQVLYRSGSRICILGRIHSGKIVNILELGCIFIQAVLCFSYCTALMIQKKKCNYAMLNTCCGYVTCGIPYEIIVLKKCFFLPLLLGKFSIFPNRVSQSLQPYFLDHWKHCYIHVIEKKKILHNIFAIATEFSPSFLHSRPMKKYVCDRSWNWVLPH